MKKFLIFIMMFFASLAIAYAQEDAIQLPSQIGIVEKVIYVDMPDEVAQVKQVADIKIIQGDFKGEKIRLDNILTGNPYYDIKLKNGTKVILHVDKDEDGLSFSIQDVHRSGVLFALAMLFCALLIYVGRKKGLYSLISIAITAVLITNLLSPMILVGINPIVGTILICLLSTAITMYSVGGFNRKSTSALLGCLLSIIAAGVLSLITVKMAHLTGFSSEHSLFLYSAHPELNFVAITVSTMLLATLGAVMDVAMSIASTINEIYSVDNTKTVKELFKCGMNVGRDIIGTMANTLILVYMGSSLPLILLASNIDFLKFVNLNQVVTEIASALIGSCAIVICVPIAQLPIRVCQLRP